MFLQTPKSRRTGYTSATARSMAQRNARQQNVLSMLDSGMTKEQIVKETGLTRQTINVYIRHGRTKKGMN